MSTNRPPVETPTQRRRRLLGVLRNLGGEASPGELATASGVPARTVTRDLAALAEAGLLAGTEKLRRLTAAGWEQLGAGALPVPASSFDDAVRFVFGPYHGAFIRLVADAVVARRLWPGRAWAPGFVACGSPGRGKTAVADMMCWALGLDRVEAVRQTDQLAPGEVVGRRRALPGGQYVLEPSALVGLPFVCLDEWAAAKDDVRREALKLVHGETAAVVEGERIELHPTTLVTYNPAPGGDPRRPLPEAYWRRCIVFYADSAPDDPGLAGRLHGFYAENRPPALRLDTFRAGVEELPAEIRTMLEADDGFRRPLTDDGRLCYGDIRTAEALMLGRLARLGVVPGDDLRAVALHVAYDLLTVAETVPGQVVGSWRLHLDAAVEALAGAPGADQLVDAVRGHEQARQARATAADEIRRRSDEQGLALVGRRAEVAERFTDAAKAIERVPRGLRPQAAGLRKQLRTLATRTAKARSTSALDDLEQLGAPVIAAATAVHDEVAQRAAEARDVAQQRLDQLRQGRAQARALDSQLRERARAADQQNKARARAHKRRLVELRKLQQRKTTRPDEDVLARLVELQVVEPVDETYQSDARSVFEEYVLHRPPRIVTRTRRRYRSTAGEMYAADDLRRWEAPLVRRVVAAAISAPPGSPRLQLSAGGRVSALSAPRPALSPGPARATAVGTAEQLYGSPPR